VRIAIVSPPWVPVPPHGYGGTEAVLDYLARGLRDAGHDVLLYATGDSTCDVPKGWDRPIAVGPGEASPFIELHHVLKAYEAVATWGADVVHDHTLFGPFYGQRFGIPVVTTNHGPFASELADIYRAVAPHVALIAISHDQASKAVDTPVAAVIHHGVDIATFPVGRGDGGYALFLGRMHPDKGVDAAARIAHRAGVELRIACKLEEPLEQEYFDRAVAPLLGAGVEFVGEVGGDTKLELLGGATCLLNPIDWAEPFGMVMIQALACGTPVLATCRGSAPELIDDGVTGFVRETEEELADCLHHVDRLDRAACRRAAAERFSTERMVADHVALYERLTG
jgi:glycosyltransferase involved in cell wall biosynthesis